MSLGFLFAGRACKDWSVVEEKEERTRASALALMMSVQDLDLVLRLNPDMSST